MTASAVGPVEVEVVGAVTLHAALEGAGLEALVVP
jgi:hypothetical protein